ncbi:hypothetical protein AU152_gp74 [Mycobacterium phage Phlei]|uniref:Uncharacterized protein n=1 Tax=Mycobacterium phage Phlei TaxID=1690684 RepID=A0A0N7E4J9_9CAUD|nr:hypothetical protein AU152_gp74 [Mycobacterium phage Phlei]ALA48187.1 hypothetical protein [Mycobacterium phage Phlei]
MALIDNSQDIIDVRDIIERVEELEAGQPLEDDGDLAELDTLKGLLEDLRGFGGDHQWDGDWYPVTLIRDSYFTTYAQELAEDIGAFNSNAPWPLNRIDWSAAADDLKMDYATVDYDGVDYWYW